MSPIRTVGVTCLSSSRALQKAAISPAERGARVRGELVAALRELEELLQDLEDRARLRGGPAADHRLDDLADIPRCNRGDGAIAQRRDDVYPEAALRGLRALAAPLEVELEVRGELADSQRALGLLLRCRLRAHLGEQGLQLASLVRILQPLE